MAYQYLLVMHIVFWYHVIALWVLWSVRTQANEATKDVGFAEITIKVFIKQINHKIIRLFQPTFVRYACPSQGKSSKAINPWIFT